MVKSINAIQPSQDEFVNELRQKKYEAGAKLASKKSEMAAIEAQQRKLKVLLDAEKNSNHGSKQKKNKGHDKNKEIRLDIVRNEQKFKEQAGQIDSMRKEVQPTINDDNTNIFLSIIFSPLVIFSIILERQIAFQVFGPLCHSCAGRYIVWIPCLMHGMTKIP